MPSSDEMPRIFGSEVVSAATLLARHQRALVARASENAIQLQMVAAPQRALVNL